VILITQGLIETSRTILSIVLNNRNIPVLAGTATFFTTVRNYVCVIAPG
jgi:hypothetical protein